jgi:hypothetical protein
LFVCCSFTFLLLSSLPCAFVYVSTFSFSFELCVFFPHLFHY